MLLDKIESAGPSCFEFIGCENTASIIDIFENNWLMKTLKTFEGEVTQISHERYLHDKFIIRKSLVIFLLLQA